LASYGFAGTVTRNEGDKLREKILLERGQQVNDAVIAGTAQAVTRFFTEKGYLKASTRIEQVADTSLENSVRLKVLADKGPRVRIQDINFQRQRQHQRGQACAAP
jgi:outer membrane protein insertion porin family